MSLGIAHQEKMTVGCDPGLSASNRALGSRSAEADAIFKRVARCLIPFPFFCYALNYIDRVSVSFAHLRFKNALWMSEAAYLSCTVIFWMIFGSFLTGTASAGAIAIISSARQLGNLTPPIAIGWLTSRTHQLSASSFLASIVLAAGGMVIASRMRPQ